MKTCHFCNRELHAAAKVARTDSCPHCQSDLHCCRNCRFYDPGFNNQCREPAAEWASDKEEANFCEFFELRDAPSAGPAATKQDTRAAFDSLFKK
jgi:hypothetical protein